IIISFLFLSFSCFAQDSEYANPLSGELILSGNFGEVRGNHFHSGLDLKTGGVEGKSVYAIADGFVSRIAVSEGGFGKAIYLEHPNGKTSVYAHLSDFTPEFAQHVKDQQYALQSFEVNLTLPFGKFPVKKGELIAKSGNSGGSGGPHVHFEVRETNGQIPTNPLNHGFKVKDSKHPELQKLWIYNHSTSGHVEGQIEEKSYKLNENSGSFFFLKDTIKASGILSFGIAALDRFTSSKNVCGIYSMDVKVNGRTIHKQQMDKFPFSKKRMVNCHIDYEKRISDRHFVYRSYIAPGNKLDFYSTIENGGTILVENGKTYNVEVSVSDHAGNTSKIKFIIVGQNRKGSIRSEKEKITDIFPPKQDNSFTNNSVRVNIPNGCLYDTLEFKYDLKQACRNCVSPVHSIGKLTDTPLHKSMTISIKLDDVSETAASKAVMVSFDKEGEPIAEGGSLKWNWMTATTRSFGDYAVMLDSLAPILRPKNFQNEMSYPYLDTVKFHLEDDLSGISSYSGTLNGKWVLLEFDPKNDLLYYVKDDRFSKGLNNFRIKVSDRVGNVKELSVTIQ
ncbi:M23 family metallopeptidase, partial [Flavobacteriales bacterium]|nr:M23 family metallopeptidase [Flavobacteriales bacterium]